MPAEPSSIQEAFKDAKWKDSSSALGKSVNSLVAYKGKPLTSCTYCFVALHNCTKRDNSSMYLGAKWCLLGNINRFTVHQYKVLSLTSGLISLATTLVDRKHEYFIGL
jgi:hypothetical protein